ncbi:hypothetical protein BDV59DRAFT_116541 [Aspergillus ambiguus]|uniref:uncharacterized protein n=1 Tax=Aspergillus ambiguus TaxID=176160 RepID=UPI003CCCDB43
MRYDREWSWTIRRGRTIDLSQQEIHEDVGLEAERPPTWRLRLSRHCLERPPAQHFTLLGTFLPRVYLDISFILLGILLACRPHVVWVDSCQLSPSIVFYYLRVIINLFGFPRDSSQSIASVNSYSDDCTNIDIHM